MSPKRKDVDTVRVTAYIPTEVWEKTVGYVAHMALTTGDGHPTISNYGAISNTISAALNSYCNIVYDYSVMKEESMDASCEKKPED